MLSETAIDLWPISQELLCNKASLRDLIAATGIVISNRIQIVNFWACVTFKFDGWPRSTIGHFYTTSRLHHFKFISELELELQSGKAKFRSKLVKICPVWLWNLMDDLGKQKSNLSYVAPSFVHNCIAIGKFKRVTVRKHPIWVKIDNFNRCELEMTLKSNKAPLLSNIKFCTSFHCHMIIQTWAKIRNS